MEDLAAKEADLYEQALEAVKRVLEDQMPEPAALGHALKFIKDHGLADSIKKPATKKIAPTVALPFNPRKIASS